MPGFFRISLILIVAAFGLGQLYLEAPASSQYRARVLSIGKDCPAVATSMNGAITWSAVINTLDSYYERGFINLGYRALGLPANACRLTGKPQHA